jgi:hypothetical protein
VFGGLWYHESEALKHHHLTEEIPRPDHNIKLWIKNMKIFGLIIVCLIVISGAGFAFMTYSDGVSSGQNKKSDVILVPAPILKGGVKSPVASF